MHAFDAAIVFAREWADMYYPASRRVAIVVDDREGRRLRLAVPDAAALEALPTDDGPRPGGISMPGCAMGVLAVLLEKGVPASAPEIEAALAAQEKYTRYSLSSIEKTLADLIRVGLIRNPAGCKPRGYRFAD
jgi:predicted Zn-ribbon and HTH transcriptional regulator